ncbi:MAG: FAD-dependent oxidoreductase [Alcaligenaceae bacterium]
MTDEPIRRYTCDLAIIGAGLAGLASALRATELGLRVLVFEKNIEPQYLCNSRLTGGIFHLALSSIEDSAQVIASRIQALTDNTAQQDLSQAVAQDALRLVRWLEQQGIRFMRSGPEPWHTFTLSPPSLPQIGRNWSGRAGDVMLRTLEQRLTQLGGQILRGHQTESLTMDGQRCTGLRGVLSPDTVFQVQATAVVIADGGFQASMSELKKHITSQPEQLCQRNAKTGMGDGLRMAQRIGAAVTALDQFYGHVLSRDALHNDNLWPYPWADELSRSGIVVNPAGRRFTDEGLGGVFIANQLAKLPNPSSAFAIFDHAIWEGPGTLRTLSANPFIQRAGATIYQADTLEALASQCGLPARELVEEVLQFNEALRRKQTESLQPPRSSSKFTPWPIMQAPFYAMPIVAGITYTMGGIRIDKDSRVLNTEGLPIAGCYAAGSCTGGLEGGPRVGYTGGLMKAGITGLRAGEHVAQQRGLRSNLQTDVGLETA